MLVCHWQGFLQLNIPVVGFDINTSRVAELMSGVDSTLEVDNETLQSVLVSEYSDSNGLVLYQSVR